MKKWAIVPALFLLITLAAPVSAAPARVEAKSAVLMDMTTGTVLFEQDAHLRLHPASVTKVMTMLLIMEALDSGIISDTDTVTASESAAAKGGSQVFLKVGEQMAVREMLKSIAVSSANDCACAMAEHLCGSEEAFVAKMNARASELGMADTHFVNCTGLDDGPDAAQHLTSAYDIALMSRELMLHHPAIIEFTTIWMDSIRGGSFGLSNTNKLVRFYPGATGLKTGFTAKAGYCLSGTASRDGLHLIAVVMGAQTSSQRFAAVKSLLDYGFASFAAVKAEVSEQTVPVKLGTEKTVTAVPAENLEFLVEKSEKGNIRTEITLDEAPSAPVSKGQRLGTMTVYAGDKILGSTPMIAREAVTRLSLWDLWCVVIRKLCMCP